MAAIWSALLGVLIVCWTLREVFTDLFQPSASGSLSSILGKKLFQLGKRARWMLAAAGPLSIVIVIVCWALLMSIGFALIYWARYPADFVSTLAESPDAVGKFWAVWYFSLASLTTLGSTEFLARGSLVRIMSSIESLIGFSLLTASITWIVVIYPALGRMRTLARRASTLVRAQQQTGIDLLSCNVEGLLGELAQSVLRTRIDFVHFPLIYYFHTSSDDTSLGRFLGLLQELAARGSHQNRPDEIRLAAAVLQESLNDLADVLDRKFVQVGAHDPKAVFDAVARDHLQSVPED